MLFVILTFTLVFVYFNRKLPATSHNETTSSPEHHRGLPKLAEEPDRNVPIRFGIDKEEQNVAEEYKDCLLYTSPSPRDRTRSRMPSSA